MNILVISSNYPTKAKPNFGAFVYNLMQELAKKNNITIISPFKVNSLFKKKSKTYGCEKCKIIRPLYLSLSNKKFAGINTGNLSSYSYKKAVERTLTKLSEKPDVIYVHFLTNALPVLAYSKKNNIPLVVASGESSYAGWAKRSDHLKKCLDTRISRLICVSQENKKQLLALGFSKKKMTIIPNAVDYNLFRPLDKNKCKERLGLSPDEFIIGFIGHFIHRKGPNRIIDAISSLNAENIKLVCVGNGKLKPSDFTKVIAPVANNKLPEIYNAFDIFVLPTLNEGHCNAIEEAKACGIPIVSSKGTSVEGQIDDSTGILIDPLNINEIAIAISKLKNDLIIRKNFSANLILQRGVNSLENRAKKINQILHSVLN